MRKKSKIIRGGQRFSQEICENANLKTCYPKQTRKTKKTKNNNSKSHSKSKKSRKVKFQQKSSQNIRPGLVWARAAPKPAQNQKIEKIEKWENFARPPPHPASAMGCAHCLGLLRNVTHWGPLRGGASGGGDLRSLGCAAEFFIFFSPCVLVPLLLLSFPFSSCQSLLALVNPF